MTAQESTNDEIPESMQRAMACEAEAEREGRASDHERASGGLPDTAGRPATAPRSPDIKDVKYFRCSTGVNLAGSVG